MKTENYTYKMSIYLLNE